MNLRTKLIASFGLVLCIFAVSGGMSAWMLKEQRATVEEILAHDQPMVSSVETLLKQMRDYRKDEKDVLLTIGEPEKQRKYLDALNRRAKAMAEQFVVLEKRTYENEDLPMEVRKLSTTARENFATYDTGVREYLATLVAKQDAAVGPREANGHITTFKQSIHTADANLVELSKQAGAMILTNQQTLAKELGKTTSIILVSLGIGLLVGAVLSIATLLSITRPLGRVMAFAAKVSEGDLQARAEGYFSAEMATLKHSIEGMVGSLRVKIVESEQKSSEAAEQARLAGIATQEANEAKAQAERAKAEGMMQAAMQLEKVVEIVSSASEELSAQVEQSSRGSEVQAARVGETATAMEEMNSTVLEVARNASQAAESTDSARKQAAEGSRIVGQVVAGIGDMQRVSMAMKQDMEVLGKQAEGIGQIMNVISDIADQTNLLALNAAIEAARAGDAGRGFAVVADEVRKLAEKTMTATREVGEAISGIQQGTRKNLENVAHAAQTVENATTLANQSGEALAEIVTMVDTATDQVRSIATASEQQSATSEEINRSIEDINRISSETSDAMRQSAQAVGELASQTQSLRALIEKMKHGG